MLPPTRARQAIWREVPRLGIPPVRFADGPPGVLTRVPSIAPTATMGLAATFSRADAEANGELIGREARSHGIGVALQPFINIDRDLSAGRSYNTFGEDPFLTGQIAAAEAVGIQSQGVMAQAKHYIGYDTDGTDVVIDPQTLHEIYAAPFDWTVKAGVASIMCSYNRINGPYACGNRDLLTGVLRDEIGFKGFVTSDWGAIHATDFINAGVDMEMPGPLREPWAGPSYFVNGPVAAQPVAPPDTKPQSVPLTDLGLPEEPEQRPWDYQSEPPPATDLKKLIAQGKVSLATIDRAARRVLLQMDRFGFLDGKEKLSITPSDTAVNAAAIERTAEDAAVLLKNQGAALPLKAAQLRNIVLIGPGAGQTIAVGMTGEKAVGLPERFTGTVAALRSRARDGSGIRYAVADDMEGVPVSRTLPFARRRPGADPNRRRIARRTARRTANRTARRTARQTANRWQLERHGVLRDGAALRHVRNLEGIAAHSVERHVQAASPGAGLLRDAPRRRPHGGAKPVDVDPRKHNPGRPGQRPPNRRRSG